MIDIHTHLHPPRLFAAIRRWFADRSAWDLSAQPTDPQEVASVLRAAGVERFVFCSYAHKPGIARELNAWLAATSRDLDGYGVPLATVHVEDAAAVADIRAALDAGCVGLKLHEDVQRFAVDDRRLAAIYDELEAGGAFLLVHVGPIPWSFPRDAGAARVERVLARHPSLAIVVAHYGVPDSARYFELMARHPNLYLDTTMVFAGESPMRDSSATALVATRPDRVLYGTDFPNIPHAYGSERAGIERLQLEAPALHAVLHANAARLLGRVRAVRRA